MYQCILFYLHQVFSRLIYYNKNKNSSISLNRTIISASDFRKHQIIPSLASLTTISCIALDALPHHSPRFLTLLTQIISRIVPLITTTSINTLRFLRIDFSSKILSIAISYTFTLISIQISTSNYTGSMAFTISKNISNRTFLTNIHYITINTSCHIIPDCTFFTIFIC